MAGRWIRDGILTSEKIEKLSMGAELFYRRLMSVVDDYGRYYSKPEMLRSACYPLKIDSITNDNVIAWTSECVNQRLIILYENDCKKYLCLLDFGQRARTKSKFPEPPEILKSQVLSDNCPQPAAPCGQMTALIDIDIDIDKRYNDAHAATAAPPLSDKNLKPKPPEKQKHLDYVFLSCEEYVRLKKELGQKFLDRCIFTLDEYLTNHEKKRREYRDHNKTIRRWVIKTVREEGLLPEPIKNKPPPEPPPELESPEEYAKNEEIFRETLKTVTKKISMPV
jgi:hypothetical protein